MSDFDDEFEYESDGCDHESSQHNDFAIENIFYDAEDLRASNPTRSLELFRQVSLVDTPWRFKAFINVIVISGRLGTEADLETNLEGMLRSMDSVSKNEAIDGILTVLDSLDKACEAHPAMLTSSLKTILRGIESRATQPFSVWFAVSLRLARTYLEANQWQNLQETIEAMKQGCRNTDGLDDVMTKGSQLLDIYSIEARLVDECEAVHNKTKRLKEILRNCERVSSAVSNPRSAAIMREYAGKILMNQARFDDAYNEFYEAFKALSDSGQSQAKQLLKFAVIANILSLSGINPFDSREAKAFQAEPELQHIIRLRQAVDSKSIWDIEAIIANETSNEEKWLTPYFEELVYRMKLCFLKEMLPAYKSITLTSISKKLNLDQPLALMMMKQLILEGQVSGSFDGELLRVSGNTRSDFVPCAQAELVKASEFLARHTESLVAKIGTVSNTR